MLLVLFFHPTSSWASQAQAATLLAEALQGISALSPLPPLTGLSAAGQDPWIPRKPPCQEEHRGCAGPALVGAASQSHGQLRGAAFQGTSKTSRFFWELSQPLASFQMDNSTYPNFLCRFNCKLSSRLPLPALCITVVCSVKQLSRAAPWSWRHSKEKAVSELVLNSGEGIVCAFSVHAVLWSKPLG